MTRTTSLTIALAAAAILGGCERSNSTKITATTSAAGQPPAAMAAGQLDPMPGNIDAAADGDALIQENDRVIAENKRMVATLARYQREDFGKYERLRKGCEAQVHGTLADSAAPAVAHCIEVGW